MDKIHCHLYHSFDIRNRFDSNEQKQIESLYDGKTKLLKINELSLTKKKNTSVSSPTSSKFTSYAANPDAMAIDNVFNSDELNNINLSHIDNDEDYDVNILDKSGEDKLTENENENEAKEPSISQKTKTCNNHNIDVDVYSLGQRWYYWSSYKYVRIIYRINTRI